MKRRITELAITACIDVVSLVVTEAGALAKAAQHRAETANTERTFLIALDVEPILHEADSLLKAAGVIQRRIDASM